MITTEVGGGEEGGLGIPQTRGGNEPLKDLGEEDTVGLKQDLSF